MWFTKETGVGKVFIEHKSDPKSTASKYFQKTYRLFYSLHSSMAEIIDFVNTIRPSNLYSIAMPDEITEKEIRNYFFDSNGKFQGFNMSRASESMETKAKNEYDFVKNDMPNKSLTIRERTSFCIDSYANKAKEGANDQLDLCFGESDDESPRKSLIKRLKK